ncbi:MAG: transposase [Nanoarchaeota archaeon]
MLAYKFRLYPNKTQQEKLWKHANLLNRLYNYFLDQKIKAYKIEKKSISRTQQQAEITKLIETEKWKELNDIHSQVRQHVTDRLNKAYKSFFQRGWGFPNFRCCSKFFGICYPQSGYALDLKKNNLTTKIYGKIGFVQHQLIEGEIKRIYIKCDIHNKWYICITTTAIKKNKGDGIVGIDLGLINLITDNEGNKIPNQKHDKYFDKQIDKLKLRKNNLTKGSRKHKNLKSVIAKLYDVKIRKVNDFLHKVSHNLSTIHDTIICEDLEIKKMTETEKRGLNRASRNASWAKFMNYLDYKTNKLVKVSPQYTSQICNNCGKLHNLGLKDRQMICECGHNEDRDINAAKNIYCLGQAILTNYKSKCIVGTPGFLREIISFRRR